MVRGLGRGKGVVCLGFAWGSFGQPVLHIGICASLLSGTVGCADSVAQSIVLGECERKGE